MRWVYAAGMTAVLIFVAIVGPSFLRSDGEVGKPSSSTMTRSQVPLSQWVQPDRLDTMIQMLAAMQDLREDTAAFAESHQLVLTIRDEPPLDIWRVDGTVCGLDDGLPPMIEITRNDGSPLQPSSEVPARALLLEDGACEAQTTIAVEDETVYYVAIKLAGRDNPKTTAVVRESAVQEFTLSR